MESDLCPRSAPGGQRILRRPMVTMTSHGRARPGARYNTWRTGLDLGRNGSHHLGDDNGTGLVAVTWLAMRCSPRTALLLVSLHAAAVSGPLFLSVGGLSVEVLE
ncbi:hypothetical protein ABE10_31520 [Bacillus toyonensis]|nr:hypothetical protein [Bacillus toyonensis]